MPYIRVPTQEEKKILESNGLKYKDYGVMYRDADTIRLLCYVTRDMIVIYRGDRKW